MEIAASSGTQWHIPMTADYVNVVAGATGFGSQPNTPPWDVYLTFIGGIAVDPSGDSYYFGTGDASVGAPGSEDEVTMATSVPATPSGYSLVSSTTSGQTKTYVYSHSIANGENSVTVNSSLNIPLVGNLAVYRGVNGTSPVDVHMGQAPVRV